MYVYIFVYLCPCINTYIFSIFSLLFIYLFIYIFFVSSLVISLSVYTYILQFNAIFASEDVVTKIGPKSSLAGEIYFYRHVPSDIAHLFPKILSIDDSADFDNSCIKMEKIKGVTFAHLVVNRCLTQARFQKLLAALQQIHLSRGCETDKPSESDYMSANNCYCSERITKSRFNTFREGIYNALALPDQIERLYSTIQRGLLAYEQKGLAVSSSVIHGNPVFCNVLLTSAGKVVFIDMETVAAQGCSVPTLQGDTFQDLCKIYQSLCGYDFIILDKVPLTPEDKTYLKDLETIFFHFIQTNYPNVAISYLKVITASFFFSIIPLYENERHQKEFLKAAETLVEGL